MFVHEFKELILFVRLLAPVGQIELYTHIPVMRQLVDHLHAQDYRVAGVYLIDAQFIGQYLILPTEVEARLFSSNLNAALFHTLPDLKCAQNAVVIVLDMRSPARVFSLRFVLVL